MSLSFVNPSQLGSDGFVDLPVGKDQHSPTHLTLVGAGPAASTRPTPSVPSANGNRGWKA
jgi:hypothetical protein